MHVNALNEWQTWAQKERKGSEQSWVSTSGWSETPPVSQTSLLDSRVTLMPRYSAADSCTWSGQSAHVWPFSVGWFCLIELSYHDLFLIIQPFDFQVKSKVNWCTHISDSGLQDADLGFLLQSCFLLNYSKKKEKQSSVNWKTSTCFQRTYSK